MYDFLSAPAALPLTRHQRKEVLSPFIDFIAEYCPKVGNVIRGFDPGPWNSEDVSALEKLVVEKCSDSSTAVDFLRVFRKAALAWSDTHRTPVVLPRIPIARKKLDNPFADPLVGREAEIRAWREVLAQWITEISELEATCSKRAQEKILNAVTVSAILYGGLMCSASLAALVRAIPEMRRQTIVADGRVHIELRLSWEGIPNVELRRWQPDPLTATLWMLLSPDAGDDLVSSLNKFITDGQIVRRLTGQIQRAARSYRPAKVGTLYSLMQSVSASCISQHLPPVLVWYANREIVSHSMTRRALQRMTRDKIEIVDEEMPEKRRGRTRPATDDEEVSSPDWLPHLLVSFSSDNSRTQIERNLEQLRQRTSDDYEIGTTVRTMADFGSFLIKSSTGKRKLRSIKAAKSILKAFAINIAPLWEEPNPWETQDPCTLERSELEAIYVQSLEAAVGRSASLSSRKKILHAAREFDRYVYSVQRQMGTEPGEKHFKPEEPSSNCEEEDETFNFLGIIDANPITPDDYEEVQNAIPKELSFGPEEADIVPQFVALGFRSGLRRREAWRPRFDDFLVKGEPELLVRPFGKQRLKSQNAKRRLPVGILLSTGEVDDLCALLRRRIEIQGANRSDYAFGLPRKQFSLAPETIFASVNKVLQDVTRDGSMHFHQLRHSFASWLMFALLLPNDVDLDFLFPCLPETVKWLEKWHERRGILYGNDWDTRRHPYLLASLMGHANPDTSLEHYVHTLDWLLRIHLDNCDSMRPPHDEVRKASRAPRSTIYTWEQKHGGHPMCIPVELWFRRFPDARPIPKAVQPSIAHGSWLERAWHSLHRAQVNLHSGSGAISEVNTCEADVTGQIARAEYLRDLEFPRGGLRHEMEWYISNPRRSELKVALACPARPGNGLHNLPAVLTDSLERLAHDQPALIQTGLSIFVTRVQRDNLVRFENINQANDAVTYLEFLRALGIQLSDIEFISGDRHQRSVFRQQWREILKLGSSKKITGPASRANVGGKKAISIRAKSLNGHAFGGGAGWRFALLMAFIVFGPSPDRGANRISESAK